MKNIVLLILAVAGSCVAASAQNAEIATRVTDDARFQMIQVPWDKVTTFRLDKYRGFIYRLGTCVKDDSIGSNKCWKEMIVLDLPKEPAVARTRYQIVINSLLKTVFLLHVDTGQTWQYALDPTEKWHPFIECSDRTNSQCLWRPLP